MADSEEKEHRVVMGPATFVTGQETDGEEEGRHELKREMKPRHVQMFSIACAIGTGLIIGSGTALVRGGPGSLFVAYVMVGFAVFFVMTSLGEMAALLPMNKGFAGYASRMVDPAFGAQMSQFACGWNYFFKYVLATPTNLTGAGLIIRYWRPDLNVAIWITVFGVAIAIINSLHVSRLGETEFVLGCAKITIMTIMILSCFVISLGGGPNHDRSGFRYWSDPGAFAEYLAKGNLGRFLGFWACLCQSCFSYLGTEVVGMTFGETPNPRKNIPRAVKHTFWRITLFYVIGVLVLGMAVKPDSKDLKEATTKTTSASASPFVLAMTMAGIKIFPDFINACLLFFTCSAACTDVYCASRTLYGLARDGQAPKIFGKTLKNGNPIWAVMVSCLPVLMGYMNARTSSAVVFQYFVSLTTIFAVLNWMCVLLSYIAFRRALKAQNFNFDDLPYRAMGQPWGAYYALLITLAVCLFSGYDAFYPKFKPDQFVLKYLGNVLFVLNVLIWKYFKRTKRIKSSEVDLVTGRRAFEKTETDEPGWTRSIRNVFARGKDN
ncbi:hypothetical protein Purlil1_10634 [Purpureocillium lilacinum]|uniref:Amino acid permease/ SLC12A domain-containing protein n=1 Tax=Purpureocillium lilacinum TaxID=33203 RepID=A0ABR0BLU0_PURLI|nr:hypothetical protein Purlil1_10634 [Purpureocillium lilacinum]